jgi:hypothetical protein
MATATTLAETTHQPGSSPSGLLVVLTPLPPEALEHTISYLAAAFEGIPLQVASPDPLPPVVSESPEFHAFTYTPAAPTPGGWLLTAADFLNSYKLLQEHGAQCCLLLGPEAQSIAPGALSSLGAAVLSGSADLAVPRYSLGPRDGLVNSAILYPATRAIFGTRARYPLAIDLGLSRKMAERLASAAQKFTAAGQNAGLLWPVSDAAVAGMSIVQVEFGSRALPPPDSMDLNTILAQVAGSLFADVESKAAFWQRARLTSSAKPAAFSEEEISRPELPDIQPMLESFRLAYSNLHEIWSLVLPPNSLLGLKKLSQMPPASFRMPDALWARIVYDFILAYRLRTINRGHLMGALTPLYLAWVASHLRLSSGTGQDGPAAESHIEAMAAVFEADKPYLVSRWRWPDRFNP